MSFRLDLQPYNMCQTFRIAFRETPDSRPRSKSQFSISLAATPWPFRPASLPITDRTESNVPAYYYCSSSCGGQPRYLLFVGALSSEDYAVSRRRQHHHQIDAQQQQLLLPAFGLWLLGLALVVGSSLVWSGDLHSAVSSTHNAPRVFMGSLNHGGLLSLAYIWCK